MICPYCKQEAEWVENREIYGRNYGKSYMCYLCRNCDAYVGCHNNSRTPLGVMANKELRDWRKKVHAVIDPIWQSGQMSRGAVYGKISHELGFSYHTGESDVATCRRVLALIDTIF